MQATLRSDVITCDHCLTAIRRAVDAQDGARFLAGDATAQTFVVDVDGGAALDRVAAALAEIGYPLSDGPADVADVADVAGEPGAPAHDAGGADPRSIGWTPAYRVTPTGAGADVNYACYCGCEAGFAIVRARADAEPEGCCCGNRMLVADDAVARLQRRLEAGRTYRVERDRLATPWGTSLEVALAIPADG